MNKKIIVYVVIILVIVVAVIFYFVNMSQNSGVPAYQTPVAQTPSPLLTTPPATVPPATTSTAPKTVNISISNFSFNPQALNINTGDTVVWTNQDSVPHQVWSDSFKGPVISNGQSYSFVFNSAGTFSYHCNIHPSMTGTITVQ